MISDLLLSASGVDKAQLTQAPSDRARYVGVGSAVVFTAALAGCSAAFALHLALHLWLPAAVAMGALWGCGIFGLDRWLVATSTRQRTVLATLAMALPRLVLAVLVGIVVSTPLVLQAFSVEITQELVVMHREESAAFQQRITDDPTYSSIGQRDADLAAAQAAQAAGVTEAMVLADPKVLQVQKLLDTAKADFDEVDQQVACEHEGSCGSGRAGIGPAYRDKVERRARLATDIAALQSQVDGAAAQARAALTAAQRREAPVTASRLADAQRQLEVDKARRSAEIAAHEHATDRADGLLSRLEALHRLSSARPTLGTAHLVLTLFLTALECLPVLVKVLMLLGKPCAYERLLTVQQDFVEGQTRLARQGEHNRARVTEASRLQQAELIEQADLQAAAAGAERLAWHKSEAALREADRWNTRQMERELAQERAEAEDLARQEDLRRARARVAAEHADLVASEYYTVPTAQELAGFGAPTYAPRG